MINSIEASHGAKVAQACDAIGCGFDSNSRKNKNFVFPVFVSGVEVKRGVE